MQKNVETLNGLLQQVDGVIVLTVALGIFFGLFAHSLVMTLISIAERAIYRKRNVVRHKPASHYGKVGNTYSGH